MFIEPNKPTPGLRLIALFEGLKGALGVVLAIGLHDLARHHIQPLTAFLIRVLHLSDAGHSPHLIVEMLAHPERFPLEVWMVAASGYTTLRFTEAYGLWLARRWGEWLALLSAALYLPLELFALTQGLSWLKLTLLALNTILVTYLAAVLRATRRKRLVSDTLVGGSVEADGNVGQ